MIDVFIILKISKHCNSYCSVRCILRMPELKKLFLFFFFNNGKYLLTFIKFNRFMKKNKPNFFNWNRTKSNEEMKISSHTFMYIKIRFINQRKIKTKEVLIFPSRKDLERFICMPYTTHSNNCIVGSTFPISPCVWILAEKIIYFVTVWVEWLKIILVWNFASYVL